LFGCDLFVDDFRQIITVYQGSPSRNLSPGHSGTGGVF